MISPRGLRPAPPSPPGTRQVISGWYPRQRDMARDLEALIYLDPASLARPVGRHLDSIIGASYRGKRCLYNKRNLYGKRVQPALVR